MWDTCSNAPGGSWLWWHFKNVIHKSSSEENILSANEIFSDAVEYVLQLLLSVNEDDALEDKGTSYKKCKF